MKTFNGNTEEQLKKTLHIFMQKAFALLKQEYGHLMQQFELKEVKTSFENCLSAQKEYFEQTLQDMRFIYEKDPALKDKEEREVVVYKSLPLILMHRLAHSFYQDGKPSLARFLSEINRQINQAEIHPGASIGTQIFIDHPTGLIVGETAVIGNRFQSFGQVLLGNNGKHMSGRRHPHIGENVTIYPQSVVSGPLNIGNQVVIGVGSTVTMDIPDKGVVVGVNQLTRVGSKKINISLKEYWDRQK